MTAEEFLTGVCLHACIPEMLTENQVPAGVERSKMGRTKNQTQATAQADVRETLPLIQRLHPALRAHFVPLPDEAPTLEDCAAVFGGDHRALYEMTRLVVETGRDAAK